MKPPRIVHHHDTKLQDHLDKLNKTLGRISFGTSQPDPANPGRTVISNNEPDRNLDIWKATGTAPAAANTDFTITHNLGRVPTTIVGQDTQNGGLLYRSPVGTWTATTVTFRCTVANSQYVVILG